MSPTGPKSSSRPIKAAGCGGDLSCYVISNKPPSDTGEVTYPGPGSRRDNGGQADYDLTPGAIRHLPSGAGDGGTMQEAGASTHQVYGGETVPILSVSSYRYTRYWAAWQQPLKWVEQQENYYGPLSTY